MFSIKNTGNEFKEFYTRYGLKIAVGYNRIVYGGRGPYIEFDERHLRFKNLFIPQDSIWRIHSNKAFYVEYRSVCPSYVKVYFQKKPVRYADYKIGLYYISPFDLENIIKDEYDKNLLNTLFMKE